MKIEMLTNQYGYTLLRRVPDGPVEVRRESDDVHVHNATEFLDAFKWAYEHPTRVSGGMIGRCLVDVPN